MAPKLTDVFVVREASVQSLAQRYKVPTSFVQSVNDNWRHCSDVLLALFIWTKPEPEPRLDSDPEAVFDSFKLFMRECGNVVCEMLKRFPKKKDDIMHLTHEPSSNGGGMRDAYETIVATTRAATADETGPDLSARALMKFPDDSYWVELKSTEECDLEGDIMQHCGESDGDMYSLRDKLGKSQVTAEIGYGGYGEADGGRILLQCKGKQNKAPDRKYWPLILKLCEKLNVTPDNNPGAVAEEELFDWLRTQSK